MAPVLLFNPDALPLPLIVVIPTTKVVFINIIEDFHVVCFFGPLIYSSFDLAPDLWVCNHRRALLIRAIIIVKFAIMLV